MFEKWVLKRYSFDVPCTVEIEHTNEYLKAHVDLGGVEVGPGDQVQVHDAPTDVRFGERVFCHRRATVTRGGLADRVWARVAATGELNELYDLSFSSRRQL
ncbi:hypothetical protein J2T57_003027 [Natronocella acetinitrilica]|uniref:Uncharacterized protein n=1 Tax=Natronocella acetinitrilica TaxID=414046 RepID=A0AAE3G5Q6_9GAMM|nr:hypothetical protein [Natronocella acetinitrilica]MCP1675872.1 hypothetical protein [Natronocella acetinitrilica]